MRILVVSDTHGNTDSLRQALLAQPRAEIVLHLGDGENDLKKMKPLFPNRTFLQVRGNCDFASTLPLTEKWTVNGVCVFLTHGHAYGVKWQDTEIKKAARSCHADILLYGHTHMPLTAYEDGLYVMNPGSLKTFPGSYGWIDITEQGIFLQVQKGKEGLFSSFGNG